MDYGSEAKSRVGCLGAVHAFLYVALVFFCMVLQGCQSRRQGVPTGQLRVLATTGMIYDAVRIIGGDSVQATALMGPGVDPHLYKATQGDLKKISEANLILYNGLFLEGKMGEVFEKQARLRPVYAVGEAIPQRELRKHPTYEDAYDPHIWFDVGLWKKVVQKIEEVLAKHDPYHAPYYEQNAKDYLSELDSLDAWLRDTLAVLPAEKRILVTAHDAFGYFGRAYDLEVVGLQGISTQSEFGLRDLADVVSFVCEREVPALFAETSVSDRAIYAIIEGAKAQGHTVILGEKLYSDAMGAFGTEEGTYIGMLRANTRRILRSLVPPPPPPSLPRPRAALPANEIPSLDTAARSLPKSIDSDF